MSAQSSEVVSNAELVRTPDELIGRLKSQSENTLADKVDQARRAISSTAKDQWAELRSKLDVPTRQQIIDKVGGADLAAKLNVAEVSNTETAEKKAPTFAETISETAKTGGAGAALTAGFAAISTEVKSAFSDVHSAEGMQKAESALSAWEKISNKFSQVFNGIKLWFATSFPSIAKWFGIETPAGAAAVASGAIETGKNLAKDAQSVVEKGKTVLEKNINDQEWKKYGEEMMAKIGVDSSKKEAFFKVFDKYRDRAKLATEKIVTGTGNPVVSLVDFGENTTSFAFDLAKSGVIPWENITLNLVEGTGNLVWVGIKSAVLPLSHLATEGVEKMLNKVSMDSLNKAVDKLSNDERAFLIGIIYRKMGLVTQALGYAAQAATYAVTLAPTWSERQGFNALASGFDGALGNYDNIVHGRMTKGGKKLTGGLDELIEKLGMPKDAQTPLLQAREHLVRLRTKALIAGEWQRAGGDAVKFQEAVSKLGSVNIDPEVVKSVQQISVKESQFAHKLSQELQKTPAGAMGDVADWCRGKWAWIKGPYANAQFMADSFAKDVNAAEGALANSVKDGKCWTAMQRVLNCGKFEKIPGSYNRMVVSVRKEDLSMFEANMKVIATEAPAMVKMLFTHAPIIAVLGLTKADEENGYMTNLAHNLLYMVPFVGPICILAGEKGNMTKFLFDHPIEAGLAGTMLVVDTWGLVSVARAGSLGKIGMAGLEYMGRPVIQMGELAAGAVRVVNNASFITTGALRTAEVGESAGLIKFARGAGISAALLAIIVVAAKEGYNWHEAKKDEEARVKIAEGLKKDGIVKDSGEVDSAKLGERLTTMESKHKCSFLNLAVNDALTKAGYSGAENQLPFRLSVEGGTCNIQMENLVDVSTRNYVATLVKDLGLHPAISYSPSAISRYAEVVQTKANSLAPAEGSSTLQAAMSALKELGISDSQKYFELIKS